MVNEVDSNTPTGRKGRRISSKTHQISYFKQNGRQIRIQRCTLYQVVLVLQVLDVPQVRGRLLIIEPILLDDHFKSSTIIIVIVKDKQFEEVAVVEVFFEVSGNISMSLRTTEPQGCSMAKRT